MSTKYSFPAIMVRDSRIRFNTHCEDTLLQNRRIRISKAGPLVIFRSVPGPSGFLWRRDGNGAKTGGVIPSQSVLYHTGLRAGKDYKLFPYKDGLAVNINEPLEV